MSTFPERLKLFKEKRNIMSKTMAEMLEITPRNYLRYEKGEVDPPTSKTMFLADFFGVSIDYLVGRTDKPEVNK